MRGNDRIPLARPSVSCPCCGAMLPVTDPVTWQEESTTLIGRGHSVIFTPIPAEIFDVLWRNAAKRKWARAAEIFDKIYALDPNGGPEHVTQCISTHVAKMRRQIAPLGLVIESSHAGYLLRDTRLVQHSGQAA